MARRDKSILRLDAVRVEGALIQPDVLALAAAGAADGQEEAGYSIDPGLNLRDEIGRAYRIAHAMWKAFEAGRSGAHPWDVHKAFTTGILSKVLGFTLATKREFTSRTSAGFELLQVVDGPVPVTIAGVGGIDQVGSVATAGDDAVRRSATTLLQGELNSGEGGLWGIATNGPTWRILRDNESITRPGYIEMDLARIFRDDLYSEFTAFWLLAHRSRFPHADAASSDCPLERWRQLGREQGVTARDDLRDGVQAALFHFGRGFLENPANAALVARLNSVKNDRLTSDDFFRQLLRLVYRLIFVMTAEDREILHPQEAPEAGKVAYAGGYATGRLRERARNKLNWDRHHDAYQGIKAVFRALSLGETKLALPALGGLFASDQTPDIDAAQLMNKRFLVGLYHLAWLRREGALARINWRDMETEEFGSVYESLLELTPQVTEGGTKFSFMGEADEDKSTDLPGKVSGTKGKGGAKGNQRKTTGSYYTPDSLVQLLLNEALDPVIARKVAENPTDAEALLTLKVIDPACGSGHFVLAAARRIARKLAELRHSGSPTLGQYRHALRDVARHCIHGVDRNPMAVELCKVAIWIETVEPGKPLTFMDQKIRCGDSLLGVFDFTCLAKGIPDEAYAPLSGDSKAAANYFRRINAAQKDNSNDQHGFDFIKPPEDLVKDARKIESMAEDSLDDVVKKRSSFEAWQHNGWIDQKRACDLWTAAFVLPKIEIPTPAGGQPVPTSIDVWLAWSGSHQPRSLAEAVEKIARERAFLHWPLVFAEVMASGGFDCVVGNPPWDQIQLDPQEFFEALLPEIANAKNMSARNRLIKQLQTNNKEIYDEYMLAVTKNEQAQNFIHDSGRYTLANYGRLSLASLFTELSMKLGEKAGRVGLVVPSGIVSDEFSSKLFREMMSKGCLVSFYSFENEEKLFPGIANVVRFGVLTLSGEAVPGKSRFAFYLRSAEAISNVNSIIELDYGDIEALNPITKTCPVFRSKKDFDITLRIVEKFGAFSVGNDSPWNVSYLLMFMMNEASGRFVEPHEKRPGPFTDAKGVKLPLYEGKFISQFDHRFGSYAQFGLAKGKGGRGLPYTSEADYRDIDYQVTPRYWMAESDVVERVQRFSWKRKWMLAWRDVTSAKLERTVVASIIPMYGAGHTCPIMLPENATPQMVCCLLANLNSIPLDYFARQKVAGSHLTFGYMNQLPILPPSTYNTEDIGWISDIVLELCYTANDLRPFAQDLGYDEPPFVWDEERRAFLRAELDAYFARIYGLSRDELRYILEPSDLLGASYPSETFRVLRTNEISKHDEYRTKRLTLAAWDRQCAQRPFAKPLIGDSAQSRRSIV